MRASVFVISMALATPAFAGSSQGERAWMPIGVEHTGAPEKASTYRPGPVAKIKRDESFIPLAEGVVPQTGWNPFGTVVTPAAELDRQVQYLRALRRQSYAGTTCNSDFLSVDQAAFCWFSSVPSANYSTVGGSMGGSDSGSDGSDGAAD
jgi:hypothetical protein